MHIKTLSTYVIFIILGFFFLFAQANEEDDLRNRMLLNMDLERKEHDCASEAQKEKMTKKQIEALFKESLYKNFKKYETIDILSFHKSS